MDELLPCDNGVHPITTRENRSLLDSKTTLLKPRSHSSCSVEGLCFTTLARDGVAIFLLFHKHYSQRTSYHHNTNSTDVLLWYNLWTAHTIHTCFLYVFYECILDIFQKKKTIYIQQSPYRNTGSSCAKTLCQGSLRCHRSLPMFTTKETKKVAMH